jgi:hypothetical protein
MLILVFVVYKFFFQSEAITVPSEAEAVTIGEDLKELHAQITRVNFDQTIFSSPGYLGLTDFSTTIQPQPTGRPNPFNIIGRD